MMNQLLQQACIQSEQCITKVLANGQTQRMTICKTKSRLCERGTIANAICRVLQMQDDMQDNHLTEQMILSDTLSDTWLHSVYCENGFLNFTLSDKWYDAVVQQAPAIPSVPTLPNVVSGFPALICGEDACFADVLGGKALQPERMARRDKCNAGWFVRCTAERLATLEQRSPKALVWTVQAQALVRQLVCFDADAKPKAQVQYLCDLCELLWAYRLEALPLALNRYAQAVVNAGRVAVQTSATKR